VAKVVAEAANTLQYYPSLRVTHRLHQLLEHADDKVREQADASFRSLRDYFLYHLCGKDRHVAEHIRGWLQPVWNVLAFTEEELRLDEEDTSPARREQPSEAIPVGDLLALLADPDASPLVLGDRLRSNGWAGYNENERRRLRAVLLTHPDQLVRDQAAWAFAVWRDADGLLELVRDADFCVRKSAMYNLGQLPPSPSLADIAWDHLHRHDTLGTHATETLATFVKHSDPAVAVRRLGWIAGDHGYREELRVAAVHHLTNLGAVKDMGQLVGLLLEPPEVTWALHLALLHAITDLGLSSPDVRHLWEVDQLHVQVAITSLNR
jgi:hypothetical protein